MNIVTYNLIKFQSDNKLNNKKLALMLGCLPKDIRKMKKESYVFSNEEKERIANLMMISVSKLETEMNERINLREKKIYGTDYLYVDYKVLHYKSHIINTISCIIDILFLIILVIMLLTKQISLSVNYTKTINVLKSIFLVELFVFPFMFIAFPLLKIYFNRTYEAVLTSNIKEYYQEEACGIIFSCLRRGINKSLLPQLFTIFSEGVIALYSLLIIIYTNQISFGYFTMIILFVISFVITIISFKYHLNKYSHKIKKGE